MSFIPSYLNFECKDELQKRANKAKQLLTSCSCCPRCCKADRTLNKYGYCQSGALPIVSSFTTHYGEEPVLSGKNGAGNIFFGNCNLKCIFCQNHEISQNWKEERNHEITPEKLAEIMIELQLKNCHNIGLVSPTHFTPQILEALYIASSKGLNIPIIYNSNGYDSVEILKLFDGVIDIYLPDLKYGNNQYAKMYSDAIDYFDIAKTAIKEMFNQVGPELVYDDGVVVRGLIIRHLVLPNDLSETERVFEFIATELSPEVHISLMSQYFPTHKAHSEILLNRTIRNSEYEKALSLLEKYDLKNGWIQEMDSYDNYRPDFRNNRENPFANRA
jgi:putative pyruvate formate lyase activating enzyme